MNEQPTIKHQAREIFAAALDAVDAGRALRAAVRRYDARLEIVDDEFDLDAFEQICAVGLGKAASALASALGEILGARLTRGIVSAPAGQLTLSPRWQVFAGGHPLPNEASLAAGRAARDMLRAADANDTLLVFLISGGGSAMLELPRDERITLADLRATNHALVNCGAPISEVNTVRRALSAIKGGGLSALAPRATQVSLIVSDTNPHERGRAGCIGADLRARRRRDATGRKDHRAVQLARTVAHDSAART
jgi:hydroxypyruvate reductase